MKLPSLKRKHSSSPPESEATAPTKPATNAPSNPAIRYRGAQITTLDGGKRLNAWVSSYRGAWWLIEDPSPADIQAGISARWGHDGICALTNPVRQSMRSGKCFTVVSKVAIEKAARIRAKLKAQSASRTETPDVEPSGRQPKRNKASRALAGSGVRET